MTQKEKEKRREDLNKYLEENVLNADQKNELEQMNYAEQLLDDKRQAYMVDYAMGALETGIPLMRTTGVKSMITNVQLDNAAIEAKQNINESRNGLYKDALRRYEEASGMSTKDILESMGYDTNGKDDYNYEY